MTQQAESRAGLSAVSRRRSHEVTAELWKQKIWVSVDHCLGYAGVRWSHSIQGPEQPTLVDESAKAAMTVGCRTETSTTEMCFLAILEAGRPGRSRPQWAGFF